MTTTVTDGTTSVTPALVVDYAHQRRVRTLVHEVIGRPDPDVTLRPAATRSGTLRALLTSPADVDALDAMLAAASILTVSSTDEPRLDGLRFAVGSGEISVTLESTTTWIVEWPYVEVPA